MSKKILVIKSSPRGERSESNKLVDVLVKKFTGATITNRDVSANIPFVTEKMIGGFYSDPNTHSEETKQALILPKIIVQEVLDNDIIIIGVPMYNFGIPAALKAWVDLVVQAGVTFKFNGPGQYEGLLKNKKAYLILATGGAQIGSPYDLASSYLKSILAFIGITDVTVHGVSGTNIPDVAPIAIKKAKDEIEALTV